MKDHELKWLEQDGDQIIRDWTLDIPIEDIIRMQAADAEVVLQRNPTLVEMAERALEQGLGLLEPVVLFRVLKVEQFRHERFTLESGDELQAQLLTEHLKSAEFVVAALCSIGGDVEKLAKEQFRQNPVFGLALEGFGSAAVEALATEFCASIEEQAARTGMASSIPLSPGMVGWSVDAGQKQIFEILDTNAISVQLTESSMMLPVKTISLMLGVGAEIRADGSTCDYCSMRERCHYRDHYINVEKS
jgi:hypothetical protein